MKATEAASLSCFEVGHKTATDLDYGLTSAEVVDRHRVHGFNEFHITQEEPLWKKYIAQVNIVTGRTRSPCTSRVQWSSGRTHEQSRGRGFKSNCVLNLGQFSSPPVPYVYKLIVTSTCFLSVEVFTETG